MSIKTYKGYITELESNQIFVFGSNTEGRHGKGAAKIARERFKAKYGQAIGLQGQSYSIVTKDLTKKVHPSISLPNIMLQIKDLYLFARENPNLEFFIAYRAEGTNLNGYSSEQMARLFSWINIPDNIIFEEGFSKLLFK